MIDFVKTVFGVSIRRACRAVQAPRSTYHYVARRPPQEMLRKRIRELAETHVRYGYRRIHILLCREGWRVNVKRVRRLYNLEGLQVRLKPPRRRVMAKLRSDRSDAMGPNEVWAMDWMFDETFDGKRLWVLTMIDTWSRVSPGIRVCRSATAMEVVEALDEACQRHGFPRSIRVDQGCQFTSKELDLWAYGNGVVLDFSRPGKPTDNAYAESFNAIVRMECLGQHWFMDLDDAREKLETWRQEYNEVRPHGAIGDRPPSAMLPRPGVDLPIVQPPEFLR
ncbi:mobile element protein [Limimaricola cinnabarinus LL-001]|uniref:Mobile element protein n=2 Tax=Limimaricola cinnabarinus TaxID=1125964 RepID=U2YL67_9RHOB|nr:mobile element protein [Limimaricola cinnabarinus LL-001]